jgi:hypothetical protein
MKTNTASLTADQILMNILNAKGQFVKAVWKSNPTPAGAHKKAGVVLEKRTTAVCRAGVNFANLSSVKEGIESGERGEVQPLSWGEWWVDDNDRNWFPYIIKHTPKGSVDEQFYIRLYPTETRPNCVYFVNNQEVDRETFASYLTPSEAAKMTSEDRPECFTIKKDNILSTEEFGE